MAVPPDPVFSSTILVPKVEKAWTLLQKRLLKTHQTKN